MGNAVGTMAVLIIRFFFKEVYRLLALMIFFAALVLFELAQTSVEHIIEDSNAKHENDERTQHSNSTKVAIYIHD
jgi:diacylglycerol kinase